MIECKTAGPEYDKALRALGSNPKSQLMSYLQQDRDALQMVLYSSEVITSPGQAPTTRRSYAGFAAGKLEGKNVAQLFDSWDKQLYTSGLFESAPYMIDEKPITIGDLTDMSQADGSRLFNAFKEILRRHAVSDNANAFNKIFNLFICKVLDEDKTNDSDVTDFQWLGSESDTIVLDRLSNLYSQGMQQYLELDVADRSSTDLEPFKAALSQQQAEALATLFAEVRQFNNTDFAFIDVFDQPTYQQNAVIVRDIVRLLQTKRLRYTEKHGFMGLFFEKLLNTSMKQESGQFFTPPPIAQFVNEALPVEKLIADKLESGDVKFLPYAIDYAAGSGHFLTEFMDRTDKILKTIPAKFKSRAQKQNYDQWRQNFNWAGEFVYGVELDYRLAKAAKVSTFLNGDGAAHVVRGNGLGHFHKDVNFRRTGGKLWRPDEKTTTFDLPNFDVVVANPPYSVNEFISGVEDGGDSFELFGRVSATSDKIETLFLERTKQLLRDGGVAGIILPTSILSNEGFEAEARRLLLRYFEVIAIVSLSDRVFIATTTPTSVLFLRRRSNSAVSGLINSIDAFFASKTDASINGMANGVACYTQVVHGASFADYVDALSNPLTSSLKVIQDYEWSLLNNGRTPAITRTVDPATGDESPTAVLLRHIEASERARMEAYFITAGRTVIQVNSPVAVAKQREFLGYTFSERKQHEGISLMSGTDVIDTPLFDPNNPNKISTFIKNQFDVPAVTVPVALQPSTSLGRVSQPFWVRFEMIFGCLVPSF